MKVYSVLSNDWLADISRTEEEQTLQPNATTSLLESKKKRIMPFYFERLPAELQVKIFELVVADVDDKQIGFYPKLGSRSSREIVGYEALALCRADDLGKPQWTQEWFIGATAFSRSRACKASLEYVLRRCDATWYLLDGWLERGLPRTVYASNAQDVGIVALKFSVAAVIACVPWQARRARIHLQALDVPAIAWLVSGSGRAVFERAFSPAGFKLEILVRPAFEMVADSLIDSLMDSGPRGVNKGIWYDTEGNEVPNMEICNNAVAAHADCDKDMAVEVVWWMMTALMELYPDCMRWLPRGAQPPRWLEVVPCITTRHWGPNWVTKMHDRGVPRYTVIPPLPRGLLGVAHPYMGNALQWWSAYWGYIKTVFAAGPHPRFPRIPTINPNLGWNVMQRDHFEKFSTQSVHFWQLHKKGLANYSEAEKYNQTYWDTIDDPWRHGWKPVPHILQKFRDRDRGYDAQVEPELEAARIHYK